MGGACVGGAGRRAAGAWLACLVGLAGCAGGAAGGPEAPPDTRTDAEKVQAALSLLGANLAPGPAVDRTGQPLAATFHPLVRKRARFGTRHELFVLGASVKTSAAGGATWATAALFDDQASGQAAGAPLLGQPVDATWTDVAAGGGDARPRWATACDVDGDGFDEVAHLYRAEDGTLRLTVLDGKAGGYATTLSARSLGAAVGTDLDMACADLEGSGRGLLVVAEGNRNLETTATVAGKVRVLDPAADYATRWTLAVPGVRMLRVAAGDTDLDGQDELVIGAAVNDAGEYHVYRASGAGAALALAEVVTGNTALSWNPGTGLKTAANASVAVGDVDGSGAPSILVAGVLSRTNPHSTVEYVLRRLRWDPDSGSYVTAAGKYVNATDYGGVKCNGYWGGSGWVETWVHEAFLKTVSLDGAARRRVLVNDRVYDENLAEVAGLAIPSEGGTAGFLFEDHILWGQPWDSYFARGHDAVEVGDFDGDGKEEIALRISTRGGVRLVGLNAAGTALVTEATYATQAAGSGNAPVLAAADVDDDGLVVEYTGAPQLVFTEPIVLAAVAAPPCKLGIGQNTDACTSTWGRSATRADGTNGSFGVTATLRGGGTGEVPFLTTFFGAKAAAEVGVYGTVATGFVGGSEHAVTRGVAYVSGPMEDMVVFTTVPYDVYTYKVLSAPAGATARPGDLVPVSVPRKPQVLQAERSYYNAAVAPISASRQVGQEVFQHTPGQLGTYPGVVQRDQLLGRYGSALASDPTAAPQGGGSTERYVDVSNSTTRGWYLNLAAGVETKLTVGYVYVGLDVGVETDLALTVTDTETTSYAGAVGGIPAASFAANQYQWGLFTYAQKDHPSGRSFPVINYWVE